MFPPRGVKWFVVTALAFPHAVTSTAIWCLQAPGREKTYIIRKVNNDTKALLLMFSGWLFKSDKQWCSEDGNETTHWRMETRNWNHGAGQSQLKQPDFMSYSDERVRHSGRTKAGDGISGDAQQPLFSQYTWSVQSTKLACERRAKVKCTQR